MPPAAVQKIWPLVLTAAVSAVVSAVVSVSATLVVFQTRLVLLEAHVEKLPPRWLVDRVDAVENEVAAQAGRTVPRAEFESLREEVDRYHYTRMLPYDGLR